MTRSSAYEGRDLGRARTIVVADGRLLGELDEQARSRAARGATGRRPLDVAPRMVDADRRDRALEVDVDEYEILREQHQRLLAISRAIVAEAEAVGDAEHPMSSLKPHRLRQLRREVAGEPAPSGLTFVNLVRRDHPAVAAAGTGRVGCPPKRLSSGV